jgi:ABC-2 type transport system permease protein
MVSLIKKELIQFFGSLIAYMILIVFALISGLFLWFFEGNMNILSGGYASLTAFFDLAPWLYLFLIPAITMRLFSEEMRNGTMELLLTRPVSIDRIIVAKLSAALVVVVLTLLLSLVYFFSVYELGHPVGVIDVAATLGSYVGLFFLSLIFLSIGLFASSLTENQIIAFIVAVLVSFFFFSGFELLSDLILSSKGSSFLISMGISSHYDSVSRGLIDSRDLFYFLTVAAIFLTLTGIALQSKRTGFSMRFKITPKYALLFVVLFSLSSFRLFRIDFTAEKRYTLSDASIRILEKLEYPLLAEIYLEGDIPPGFRRLKTAVEEKLLDIQQYGGKSIFVRRVDPYKEVPASERNEYFNRLIEQGITCTDLRIKTEQGITTKLVFPSMVLKYQEKTCVINLLKNDPSLPAEENLNRSVERLEFELMNAILTLTREYPLQAGFLEGHGEADSMQVSDLSNTLSAWYKVSRMTCDRLAALQDSVKVLIIANPQLGFLEHDKLILDQYLMKGGRMIWLIDPVKVSLDSLSEGMTTLAMPVDLNLKDLFYRYGIRFNNDLIMDAECMQIRVNTAPAGSSPHYSAAPWYFSPLLHPLQSHPVGKNVAPVSSEFVSSIDTVGENPEIRKQILLSTSSFSSKKEAPLQVNLRMIDVAPSRDFFNRSNLPVGILLEGKFSSVFKNRIIEKTGMPENFKFISESVPTKMALFADGGLLLNKVNRSAREPKILPLGYDRVSKITYGNRDFFVNLVQYLGDDASLSALKNKSWQIRLLDKVKVREQDSYLPWLNLLVPLFLILAGGVMFAWFRKRRNEK